MSNIVLEIQQGSKSSFKEFFEDYYPILCVFSSRYLKDREQCKDLAQDTLLLYWEKRKSFDNIYKVKSFLYTVIKNRCLNIIKHDRLTQSYLNADIHPKAFFEESIIEQETFLLVRKAIDALPDQMRTIIRYAMEGLKNPKIAEEMGISEGTVHSLKKTAYRKLRQQLQGHFFGILFF